MAVMTADLHYHPGLALCREVTLGTGPLYRDPSRSPQQRDGIAPKGDSPTLSVAVTVTIHGLAGYDKGLVAVILQKVHEQAVAGLQRYEALLG